MVAVSPVVLPQFTSRPRTPSANIDCAEALRVGKLWYATPSGRSAGYYVTFEDWECIAGNANDNNLRVTFNGSTLTGAFDGTITNIETIYADMGAGTDWLIYTATTAAVVVNVNANAASGSMAKVW